MSAPAVCRLELSEQRRRRRAAPSHPGGGRQLTRALATVHLVTPTMWEPLRRVNPLVWDSVLAAACLIPTVIVGVVAPADATAVPAQLAFVAT